MRFPLKPVSLGVVTVLLMSSAAAHAQPASTPHLVPVTREEDDLFADPSFEVTQASYGVQPTALLDSAIDPVVVQRLVQQRLGQAATLALTDLLQTHASKLEAQRPMADMVLSLQALIVPASDAETRTQGLLAAVLRDGLVFGLHRLLQDSGGLDASDCKGQNLQLTAIYEGLAVSRYLRPLGFPLARGLVEPQCQKLAGQVAQMVDTVAALGTEGQQLVNAAQALFQARTACSGEMVKNLPIELRSALDLEDEPWNQRLVDVRRLAMAFQRHRATLASRTDDGGLSKCFQSLDGLVQRMGGDLETFGAQVPRLERSLEQLRAQLLRTTELFPSWKGDEVDQALVKAGTSLPGWTHYVQVAQEAGRACSSLMNGGTSFQAYIQYASVDGSQQPDNCKRAFAAFVQSHNKVVKPLLDQLKAEKLPGSFDEVNSHLSNLGVSVPTDLRARVQLLRGLLRSVARSRQLRRDDIIQLARFAEKELVPEEKAKEEPVHKVLKAFFSSLPEAIREDATAASGIRLDTPALATRMAATYVDDRRAGVYLRATVGVGYLMSTGPNDSSGSSSTKVSPTVFEELGVGYRFGNRNFLTGPHVSTSGLLFQFMPGGPRQRVLVAPGWSVSLYRLVDVSLNVGGLFDAEKGLGDPRWVGTLSLQLPLADYFAALSDDRGTTTSTTVPAATTP